MSHMIKIKTDYSLKKYDFLLITYTVILSVVGVFLIGSANPAYQERQIAGILLGIVIMLFCSFFDYHLMEKHTWLIYGTGLILLLSVTVTGAISGGAARWIEIGPLRFQPSELTKILLIVFFAGLFDRNKNKMNQPVFILTTLAALAVPMALILEQPDLSTTIIVGWVAVCMLYMAGLDSRLIIRALMAGVPAVGLFLFLVTRPGQTILNAYQYRRIMSWLAPGEWVQDSYQQRNSIMAVGSGGMFGKGLGNDSPLSLKNGNFLPEPHTDFIMAVAGEELGLIGCLVIVLLLGLIVFECIRIGNRAGNMAGRLICIGMAALIAGQSFVNLCVVTGLMPNTGLTLPFVSYGLTSLVSLYLGLGLVLNVGLQRNASISGQEQLRRYNEG